MGWAGITTNHATSKWTFDEQYIMNPLEAARLIVGDKMPVYVARVSAKYNTGPVDPEGKPENRRSLDDTATTEILKCLHEFKEGRSTAWKGSPVRPHLPTS